MRIEPLSERREPIASDSIHTPAAFGHRLDELRRLQQFQMLHDRGARNRHLMTDDLELEIRNLKKAGVSCDAVTQQGWGSLTRIQLPGGGTLGLYQPRHQRPQ